MRDKKRIKRILDKIEKVWYAYPDLRLTQMLTWLASLDNWTNSDLFYWEDEKLEKMLKEQVEKLK